MFQLARRLRDAGVMGLNHRNAEYIQRFNPRGLYPLVDDKLRTKKLAIAAGMAVPELYGVIATQHDVRRFGDIVAGRQAFVIKPAHGSAGDGIIVISGRSGRRYRTISGALLEEEVVEHHLSNSLSGQYSLGGVQDKVIIEYCVRADPLFESITYLGIPDIRVIVFRGFPAMAMARLPTRLSQGKANLHQGAVGSGIDLTIGETLQGSLGNAIVTEHPDTGNPIAGLRIPHWGRLLELAARCYDITGLGYIGVDIVLDRDLGPLILELNARPGLNIQLANDRGLLHRLRSIDRQSGDATLEERVEYARRQFHL